MGRPREGWKLRDPRRPGECYTVRFTSKTGQPRELSTGTRDPVEAAAEAARIYARDLTSTQLARPRVDPLLGLDEMVALYLADLEKTHDEETCATYTGYGKRFVDYFDNALENIQPGRMGDYQRDRLTKVLRKTVRKERSFLNGFLDWSVEQGVLSEDARPVWPKLPKRATGVRSGPQRAKPVDVTVVQVRAFIAALPVISRRHRGTPFAIRARFVVAYETGLRPATLDKLSVPQHWRPGADNIDIDDPIDKARFGRRVPLSALAKAALEQVVAMFSLEAGLIFGEHDYRCAIASAKRTADLPKNFAAYDLRHGRAGHLLDETGDLRAVAYILGHLQLTTTNKYLRGDEQRARRALLGPGFRGDSGEGEGHMVSAKEGTRTLTGVTPLEPESSGRAKPLSTYERKEGQEGTQRDTEGQGFGGPPETPEAIATSAKYLSAMRAEWEVYDDLAAQELLSDEALASMRKPRPEGT